MAESHGGRSRSLTAGIAAVFAVAALGSVLAPDLVQGTRAAPHFVPTDCVSTGDGEVCDGSSEDASPPAMDDQGGDVGDFGGIAAPGYHSGNEVRAAEGRH